MIKIEKSYKLSDDIQRVEICIPYNDKTCEKIYELRDHLVRAFDGITNSAIGYPTAFKGVWIDRKYHLRKNEFESELIISKLIQKK